MAAMTFGITTSIYNTSNREGDFLIDRSICNTDVAKSTDILKLFLELDTSLYTSTSMGLALLAMSCECIEFLFTFALSV